MTTFSRNQSLKSPLYYYSKAFIIPDFAKQGKFKNVAEIPQISTIYLHMGLKDSALSPTKLGVGMFILSYLTNQKASPTFAKKSIATYKLQKNMTLGVQVSLNRKKIYSFLDRLVFYILPNVKEFTGIKLSKDSTKKTISIGFPNVFLFHEIEAHYNKIMSCFTNRRGSSDGLGFQITFKTRTHQNQNISLTKYLLSSLTFPISFK